MKTFLAQNVFNSATSPVVADTAAANVQPPRVAAAEPTGPSVPPGPKLPADTTVSAGLSTNHIPEIFRVSNLQDSRQFIPDRHDIWDAMHDPNTPRALETDPVWADDAPLFLKAIGGA